MDNYYSVTKNNKTVSSSGKWVELEDVVLNKTSQIKRFVLGGFSYIRKNSSSNL